VIQSIAEPADQTDFGSKALTIVVTIIVVIVVTIMNFYLIFLYFYFGKNGMELHKKYLEELERKRQILQQRRNGNFTNLAQPGQQSAVPLG